MGVLKLNLDDYVSNGTSVVYIIHNNQGALIRAKVKRFFMQIFLMLS